MTQKDRRSLNRSKIATYLSRFAADLRPSHTMTWRMFFSLATILLLAPLPCRAQQPASQAKQADSRIAPTAAEHPETLDQLWQKASSKYDRARGAILRDVDRQANDGPFRTDWDSLMIYAVPQWYKDAKFGIFIHWGVYSVPAFASEWYPRRMYIDGSDENKHQLATYGPLTSFGYKDFIPMFKAEHYDPQAWARLFGQSGAKYVVPVFEHHDGFPMYDSGLSDWTAVKMGPRRDLVGELATAVRTLGLHFGASSHRIEHDWFFDEGRQIPSDVNDPSFAQFYGPAEHHLWVRRASLLQDFTYVSPEFADDFLARDAEIVAKYHPEIMYFDYWIGQPSVRSALVRFAAYYYNESAKRGSLGVINYKENGMQAGSGVLDVERGQFSDIRPDYWQTDTSVSNKSWGYIQNDSFKSPASLVHELIDIVSKNGNLLLSIGPRADGTIPDEVQNILLEIGSWLGVDGEAIYSTRPWKIFGEGPTKVVEGPMHDKDVETYTSEDFRFTTKGKAIYAIEMAWPSTGEAVIHSLKAGALSSNQKIESVVLLGSDAKLEFDEKPDGLHIHLTGQPPNKYAYAYRILLHD